MITVRRQSADEEQKAVEAEAMEGEEKEPGNRDGRWSSGKDTKKYW
jgi:hypothetical protein